MNYDIDYHPCEEGHSFVSVWEYGQEIGKRCRHCKVFVDEFFEEEEVDIADPDEEC